MKLSVIPRPQSAAFCGGKIKTDAKIDYLTDETIPAEGYRLEIGEEGVKVFSSGDAGKFYAEKTLEMQRDTMGFYPAGTISDAPKNPFRAVMLDSGRYFFPIETVKTLLDDAAGLKFNVFYWHLSEDQGWRPEIESRPKLTEIGSVRKTTNGFPCPSSGYYSKAEMREIVEYAHARHMIVVPEIDVPGHVRAAIAAYPEIACLERELPVATHFGVKHDILCAGKESTYRFLNEVFSELLEIFTDGYFGLGGDEAVKTRWKLCPECQRVMKEQDLKDEDALQTYFMNRLNREIFAPRGVRPVIWVHGNSADGIDKNIVQMYYGGENLYENMKKDAKAGYTVLNADSAYFYFDFPHALTPLSKTYAAGKMFEPFDNFIGGTVSLWSEYIPRQKTLEKRAFPRLLAAAESLWTKYDEKEYNDFVERAATYQSVYGEGRNFTEISDAEPKGLKRVIERAWWARRPLHWEGLHNLSDNAKAARLFKKQNKS